MNKNRLEAFSDGVFAIVITLLILDIRVPEVEYEQLPGALIDLLPRISAYVMSFVIIGLYWIAHHHSFRLISKTDGVFLWLNTLLLLLVSFFPFPTSLMGRYPFQTIPILLYGINLIAANATGFVMILYIHRHRELVASGYKRSDFYEQIPLYAWVNGIYLLALVLSFFVPMVSYFIYLAVVVVLVIVFAKRIKIS